MPEEAERLASQLCDTNVTRQQIERNIFEEAQKRIAELQIEKDMALVVDGQDWHPGVIGIVASRILEIYHRPVLVLTVRDGVAPSLLSISMKPWRLRRISCSSMADTKWQPASLSRQTRSPNSENGSMPMRKQGSLPKTVSLSLR